MKQSKYAFIMIVNAIAVGDIDSKKSHKDTHTTKWLSYTLLYKMASKTSKISRL